MNKYRLPNKKTLVRKSCVAPKENSPSLFKQEKGSCLYSVISGTEGGAASAMSTQRVLLTGVSRKPVLDCDKVSRESVYEL